MRIIADPSLIRTEVSCKECGSHLGHVFEVNKFLLNFPKNISFFRTVPSQRASATASTRPASTSSLRPPPTQWTGQRSRRPRSLNPSSPVQQHSEGVEVRMMSSLVSSSLSSLSFLQGVTGACTRPLKVKTKTPPPPPTETAL